MMIIIIIITVPVSVQLIFFVSVWKGWVVWQWACTQCFAPHPKKKTMFFWFFISNTTWNKFNHLNSIGKEKYPQYPHRDVFMVDNQMNRVHLKYKGNLD